MKTVLKYPVSETGKTTLTLRQGFRFVRFEYVLADKALYAWFEEPLKADTATCSIALKVIQTGQPVQEHFSYLSTALDPMGPEAYHLYQEGEESPLGNEPQHQGKQSTKASLKEVA